MTDAKNIYPGMVARHGKHLVIIGFQAGGWSQFDYIKIRGDGKARDSELRPDGRADVLLAELDKLRARVAELEKERDELEAERDDEGRSGYAPLAEHEPLDYITILSEHGRDGITIVKNLRKFYGLGLKEASDMYKQWKRGNAGETPPQEGSEGDR